MGSGKPLHFCQAESLSFTRISGRPSRGYPKLDSTAATSEDGWATVVPCWDVARITKTRRSAITRRLCRPEFENLYKIFSTRSATAAPLHGPADNLESTCPDADIIRACLFSLPMGRFLRSVPARLLTALHSLLCPACRDSDGHLPTEVQKFCCSFGRRR